MRRRHLILAFALAAPALLAQKHGGRSAPPTAPPPTPVVAPVPIVPASSGLGAIQFVQVNYGVPAPQSLTRQLRSMTTAPARRPLGHRSAQPVSSARPHPDAPRHHARPRPIGTTDDLDALLTVELDQHLVTAVLVPVDGNWRRVASLVYATPFDNGTITPTTWLRTARSMIQKDRYRAIFHASTGSLTGNYTENEAHLRIVNGKPIITISFESTARECTATSPALPGKQVPHSTARPGCDITQRWFQPDPADPTKKFELVTGTGHISPKDAENPLASTRTMLLSQLRSFSCQPFLYSEATQHYEPSAPNAPCKNK